MDEKTRVCLGASEASDLSRRDCHVSGDSSGPDRRPQVVLCVVRFGKPLLLNAFDVRDFYPALGPRPQLATPYIST